MYILITSFISKNVYEIIIKIRNSNTVLNRSFTQRNIGNQGIVVLWSVYLRITLRI